MKSSTASGILVYTCILGRRQKVVSECCDQLGECVSFLRIVTMIMIITYKVLCEGTRATDCGGRIHHWGGCHPWGGGGGKNNKTG